ncbi:MAG TPA: chemotaxis protein CheB [Vicinamibacterales bacterium]|jgi:two-component system chemotaxis response regulator CheB
MPEVLDERSVVKPPAVVVIGASAGGIEALSTILGGLPKDFPAPIVVVQHRSPTTASLLVPILGRRSTMPVVDALEGESLKAGVVYVARPDQHLKLTDTGGFLYVDGHRIHHVLSSATSLFESAAQIYGIGAIGVVLTGYGRNGTDGVQAIKQGGGVVIAQDLETSRHFDMPRSAIATGAVDYILPVEEIAPALVRVATARAHRNRRPDTQPS